MRDTLLMISGEDRFFRRLLHEDSAAGVAVAAAARKPLSGLVVAVVVEG